LKTLADEGKVTVGQVDKAIAKLALQADVAPPWER
jgi:hypothetical protein